MNINMPHIWIMIAFNISQYIGYLLTIGLVSLDLEILFFKSCEWSILCLKYLRNCWPNAIPSLPHLVRFLEQGIMFRNISIIIKLPSTPELFLYNKALNQLISVHVYVCACVCTHIGEQEVHFLLFRFPCLLLHTHHNPPTQLLTPLCLNITVVQVLHRKMWRGEGYLL